MKKFVSLLLAIVICVGMLPMTVFAEDDKSITYLGENGQQTITDYEAVTPSSTTLEGGTTYVVKEDCTLNSAVGTVADSNNAPVKLILCDGAELTLTKGLNMENADVIIYGQAGGTGKLTISTDSEMPTIDDAYEHRTLTVNGGSITATAGTTVAETTFSNPLSINTLNVSAGDLTLPKASRIENVAVSGDGKMIDLLDSGYAFVHWGQNQNGSTITREPIGAASLKDNPTTLTGIPTD